MSEWDLVGPYVLGGLAVAAVGAILYIALKGAELEDEPTEPDGEPEQP